jgi:hypothetical protein
VGSVVVSVIDSALDCTLKFTLNFIGSSVVGVVVELISVPVVMNTFVVLLVVVLVMVGCSVYVAEEEKTILLQLYIRFICFGLLCLHLGLFDVMMSLTYWFRHTVV